jgi:hypothetical protein
MKGFVKSGLLLSGLSIIALSAVLWLRVAPINAQPASGPVPQVNGTPGSPSATTTINGQQLPPPPQKFEGRIERNAEQSTPYWPKRVAPPKGAPNVLLIMTDDTGFGVTSTFGGVIPTPNLDRIAANGLQVPFQFTGKLNKLTLTIDRPQLSAADIEKLKQATRNNKAAE